MQDTRTLYGNQISEVNGQNPTLEYEEAFPPLEKRSASIYRYDGSPMTLNDSSNIFNYDTHRVQKVASLSPLGDCTARTSLPLDSGITGISNTFSFPIYSTSGPGTVISHPLYVQDLEHGLIEAANDGSDTIFTPKILA